MMKDYMVLIQVCGQLSFSNVSVFFFFVLGIGQLVFMMEGFGGFYKGSIEVNF